MKKILAFVVIGLVASSAAVAAPAAEKKAAVSAPAEKKTAADQLADLEAARALGKVRLEVAKQDAELAGTQRGGGGAQTPPPGSPPPAPGKGAKPDPATQAPQFVVLSISSIGDQFSAVVMANGQRRVVKAGESVAGWSVVRIDAAGVLLNRAGVTQVLRP